MMHFSGIDRFDRCDKRCEWFRATVNGLLVGLWVVYSLTVFLGGGALSILELACVAPYMLTVASLLIRRQPLHTAARLLNLLHVLLLAPLAAVLATGIFGAAALLLVVVPLLAIGVWNIFAGQATQAL